LYPVCFDYLGVASEHQALLTYEPSRCCNRASRACPVHKAHPRPPRCLGKRDAASGDAQHFIGKPRNRGRRWSRT
jgi:hypothetical protein